MARTRHKPTPPTTKGMRRKKTRPGAKHRPRTAERDVRDTRAFRDPKHVPSGSEWRR